MTLPFILFILPWIFELNYWVIVSFFNIFRILFGWQLCWPSKSKVFSWIEELKNWVRLTLLYWKSWVKFISRYQNLTIWKNTSYMLIYYIHFINKLYLSGSAPVRIYGTPKMHKFSSRDSFPKLRSIFWSIGTFNYNLGHSFCDLLSTLVPNDYSYKDTFSFVSEIKNANLSRKCLVSYDVTSLFTTISL